MTREQALNYLRNSGFSEGQVQAVVEALTDEDAVSREAVTNGEVIKKTFPHYDIEIDEHKGYVRVFYEDFYTTYPWKWWNAKYKGENK